MSVVGSQLRSQRESRGLNRVQVAKATSIYAHHLAALEHGHYDELPDEATTEGYVRTYADYLGLDAVEIVIAYHQERGTEPQQPPPDPRPEAPRSEGEDRLAHQAEAVTSSPSEARNGVSGASLDTERGPGRERGFPGGHGTAVAAAVLIVGVGLTWLILGRNGKPAPAIDARSAETRADRRPEEPPVADPQAMNVQASAGTPTSSGAAASAAEPVVRVVREEADARPTPREPVETTAPAPVTSRPSPSGSALRIETHGVGTGVTDHRLKGESDSFRAGSRVWFWTRVRGGRSGDKIWHVWSHEGKVIDRIPLTLGSADWRTQSRKKLYGLVGRWSVEAHDHAGTVLARSEFLCTARSTR